MIDTHCHLHRVEFDVDRDQVVRRATEAGINILLDPATDYPSNERVVSLAHNTPEVYAAVGIHPHDAAQLTEGAFQQIADYAHQKKVVAIGEIGLDYYRHISDPGLQKEVLKRLLSLARQTGLPVILHCRDQEKGGSSSSQKGTVYHDLFKILREIFEPPLQGLLHCFAGDAAVAQEALDLGLFISFAGNLTFSKADVLRRVAREVPMDRIVLETDAPFLAPQSRRGQRNEPCFLFELVEAWAGLVNCAPNEIVRATTSNAQRLFGFPMVDS